MSYLSLTSIQQKQKELKKTLQTVLNQTLKVDKCYIYLSEEPYLLDKGFKNKKLNDDLQQFISSHNIFEIRWTKNTGPYRKLLPLLKEKFNEDCIIITIDDDIEFDKNLVKNLVSDYNKHKCCINYRGFNLKYKGSIKNMSYECRNNQYKSGSDLYNFSTNGAGTLFHPSFFHNKPELIFDEMFFTKFPTCDDIWYNFCRIANNTKLFIDTKKYVTKWNTKQDCALFSKYNHNKNTENIRKIIDTFIKLGYLKDM